MSTVSVQNSQGFIFKEADEAVIQQNRMVLATKKGQQVVPLEGGSQVIIKNDAGVTVHQIKVPEENKERQETETPAKIPEAIPVDEEVEKGE